MLKLIKKFLHFVCATASALALSAGVFMLLRMLVAKTYGLDVLERHTYQVFSAFWDNGGILGSKELLILALFILSFVLLVFCWYKLYHFKFIKVLTVPLNWLANLGTKNYSGMPSVTIKNLKVEEKKTIEQIVQERLDLERKKEKEMPSNKDLRNVVVAEIERKKKEI